MFELCRFVGDERQHSHFASYVQYMFNVHTKYTVRIINGKNKTSTSTNKKNIETNYKRNGVEKALIASTGNEQ